MTIVRQATLDDRDAIFDFIRRAWPDRWQYKIPDRWAWQFQNNPFRDPHSLPVWIALDGARVIGQTAAMSEPVEIDGRVRRIGWSVDTMVLPEYRGRGVGTQLAKANQSAHDIFMSLSMSAENRRIKARLGGRDLPPISLFQLSLSTDRETIRRRLDKAPPPAASLARAVKLDAAVSVGLNLARGVLRRRTRMVLERRSRGITMESIDRFDERATELWQRVAPHLPGSVARSTEFLNWKFADQPHANHQRWLAFRAGRPVGILILRRTRPPERDAMILVDLIADPADSELLEFLAAWTIEWSRKHSSSCVKAASSCTELQRAFRSVGFRETRTLVPMICLKEGVPAPANPQFSYGDHDLDQYPLA